ncbi:MAG: hypothetical protein VXZ01_04040, partial [Pseudomonadota bacterium]|nr:hypothetical protein [Pseudomonadota bacterium]
MKQILGDPAGIEVSTSDSGSVISYSAVISAATTASILGIAHLQPIQPLHNLLQISPPGFLLDT